jgi:hypothetical protein
MKAEQNIFQWICGISILVFGIGIVGAAEPFENLPEDTVLVEVLGQKVCLKDIEPGSEIKKKHQDAAGGFGLWLKQTRASNLGRYFKPLWDDYAKEKGLAATEQEIKEFNKRMRAFTMSSNRRFKTKRDNLAKELIAENIEHGKREELERRLTQYNGFLKMVPDPNRMYQDDNNGIAESVILNWKLKKELYKQYKGRVIFQQAGPEPLDAFRLFFEEQQAKGKFKFYNKDAEDLFWDYYRSAGHTVIGKDPKEAEQIINTPWWLKEKEEDYNDTEAEWGEGVSGFQIRIEGDSGRRAFYSDKVPAFKMDLLNTGDKTFTCAALEQFCEVEVDGKWCKWNGPMVAGRLAGVLKPKNVDYDFLVIELAENWGLKESLTQEDKSQAIHLSLGTHIIRVKYKTMTQPDSPAVEAVSNSLKFKIIAPKSAAGG